MNKKVLILSPHADDEILGCGGFISKYSKQNYSINVLILTNANKGAPEIYSPEEIKQIRNEAKIANKFIGTKKLSFEDLPALNLNNYPIYKISNIISKYISDINPEIVLIPSANDINDDHKIILKAAKVSMRVNKKSNLKKSYMNFLQYADGTNSLEKISNLIKLDLNSVKKIYSILFKNNLID